METSNHVINAAGGNPTAINVTTTPLDRAQYAATGAKLMQRYGERYGVEQTGTLVFEQQKPLAHFEMSGGEFCGNAARAAALLISRITENNRFQFTMSGVANPVDASVDGSTVTCTFTGLPRTITDTTLSDSTDVRVVDLGGIVHVLRYDAFPASPEDYERIHAQSLAELGLRDRGAVGVVWVENTDSQWKIHPVVWVKEVDTFFYESSCGSGSIAAAVANQAGTSTITQPSGEDIQVDIDRFTITLTSRMEEVVHEQCDSVPG